MKGSSRSATEEFTGEFMMDNKYSPYVPYKISWECNPRSILFPSFLFKLYPEIFPSVRIVDGRCWSAMNTFRRRCFEQSWCRGTFSAAGQLSTRFDLHEAFGPDIAEISEWLDKMILHPFGELLNGLLSSGGRQI